METLLFDQIKKQASFYIREKYKTAKLALTDVSEAELLAEEATNSDPCSPDAKTMTTIAEASFEIDDYWRIVDVLHRRLCSIDLKQWRQSYKSLILLEFLLTHGPEQFAEEFQCDSEVIEELATYKHIEQGFNWGEAMKKKSYEILQLLGESQTLRQARLRALRITNEIQGFGSHDSEASPSNSSSPFPQNYSLSSPQDHSYSSSSSSSSTSKASPIWSCSSLSTTYTSWNNNDQINQSKNNNTSQAFNKIEGLHNWDYSKIEEDGCFIGLEEEEDYGGRSETLINGLCSKLSLLGPSAQAGGLHGQKVGFRSVSDVGKDKKKKFTRQFSLWY